MCADCVAVLCMDVAKHRRVSALHQVQIRRHFVGHGNLWCGELMGYDECWCGLWFLPWNSYQTYRALGGALTYPGREVVHFELWHWYCWLLLYVVKRGTHPAYGGTRVAAGH
jgi:hypothetical protein